MFSNGIPREQTAGAMLSIENKLEWVIQIKSSLFIKKHYTAYKFWCNDMIPQGDIKSMRGPSLINQYKWI